MSERRKSKKVVDDLQKDPKYKEECDFYFSDN
jgi:hypothetical protein